MSGTEDAVPETPATPAIDRMVSKLRAARAQGGGVEFLVDADSAAALLGEIAALRARAGSTPPAAAPLEAVRGKHPPAPPVGPGDGLGSWNWAVIAIFAGLAIWVVLS